MLDVSINHTLLIRMGINETYAVTTLDTRGIGMDLLLKSRNSKMRH